MRYVDPDGRDIRETELFSKSLGVVLAGRVSGGIAKDSNGQLAFFVKVEGGVGFGGSLYKFGNILKAFNDFSNFLSDFKNDYDAIDNLISIPEDTGKGNFSDLPVFFRMLSFKHEDYSSWNGKLPSEGACLLGAKSDENGNNELIAGVTAIAATYLIEKTLYINCSSIADYVKTRAKEDE